MPEKSKTGKHKHEIRNPKQIRMTNFECSKQMGNSAAFLAFGHYHFEFVSDFEIRISDFNPPPAVAFPRSFSPGGRP